MCLLTNWRFPRINFKPIICYKLVIVLKDNKLAGINQKNYVYNENEINKCSLFPIRGKISNNLIFYTQVIADGYFHFMDSVFSIMCLYSFAHNDKSIVIKKCIIPRFTLYYKGLWDNSIAAKRFKFIN